MIRILHLLVQTTVNRSQSKKIESTLNNTQFTLELNFQQRNDIII